MSIIDHRRRCFFGHSGPNISFDAGYLCLTSIYYITIYNLVLEKPMRGAPMGIYLVHVEVGEGLGMTPSCEPRESGRFYGGTNLHHYSCQSLH